MEEKGVKTGQDMSDLLFEEKRIAVSTMSDLYIMGVSLFKNILEYVFRWISFGSSLNIVFIVIPCSMPPVTQIVLLVSFLIIFPYAN